MKGQVWGGGTGRERGRVGDCGDCEDGKGGGEGRMRETARGEKGREAEHIKERDVYLQSGTGWWWGGALARRRDRERERSLVQQETKR